MPIMTSSQVTLHQVSSIHLAVVCRQVKPAELSRVVPECCGAVWKALRAQQAKAGRQVAMYLTADDRVEIGAEVIGSFTEAGDVVRSATPSGTAASVTHFGPYHTLGAAHETIREWCRTNGLRLKGSSWEIYGHWQDAWNSDPSQIRTDVFYLVRPASG
jgi:effector-binding domain-containing protein